MAYETTTQHTEPAHEGTRPETADFMYAFSRMDVCARLSIHPNTFDNWVRDGRLRVVKIGGKTLVPARELERLLTIL